MAQQTPHEPSPRRVAAGRRNRSLRTTLTEAGRERLRQSANTHKPWNNSTGPRSADGKERVRQALRRRRKGVHSVRELRQLTADLRGLLLAAKSIRTQALATAANEQFEVLTGFIARRQER
jgi:hypothetical protein